VAALDGFSRLHQHWVAQADAFQQVAGTDPTKHAFDDLTQLLDQTLENREALEDWTRWINVRNQACGAGLTSLVEAVEARTLTGAVEEAFTTAYAQWWLPQAMDAEAVLRGFSHWSHEDAINKFRALDDRATEMAAGQVLHRIRHGLPARDGVARKSELGTLRHQLGLQRPSMPIRSLVSEMPIIEKAFLNAQRSDHRTALSRGVKACPHHAHPLMGRPGKRATSGNPCLGTNAWPDRGGAWHGVGCGILVHHRLGVA